MDEQKKNKRNNIIQFGLLLLVLVILPAGSFYYLRKGFNYQKGAWSELQDRAVVPTFQLQDWNGDIVVSDSLKDKIMVANFTTLDELKNNKLLQDHISLLNRQFHDREEFLLLSYLTDRDSLSSDDRTFLVKEYNLRNPAQWHVFYGAGNKMEQLHQGFNLPKEEKKPYFALIDTLVVKNYYAALDFEEVSKLAQHLSIILPREETKDIILKRDKEK